MFRLALLFAVAAAAAARSGRIIGGNDTAIEEYPHQNFGDHFCGGSILKDKIILTAAHCLMKKSPYGMEVRVGTSRRQDGGTLNKVTIYKYCDGFTLKTFDCDVAVVILQEPISFSISAQSISLVAPDERPKQGEMLTTTGWGFKSTEDWKLSDILQVVRIPVIDESLCVPVYANYTLKVTKNMLCAGGGVDRGNYQGDSGGPLINSKRQLVGIVSWGPMGITTGKPGVYADVTSQRVRSFIEENIK